MPGTGIDQTEAAQLEVARKALMNKILTKEALERLGRVRLANPSLAMQLEAYLIQVYQSGQLNGQIDDAKMKQILNVLTEKRKTTTKIKRR